MAASHIKNKLKCEGENDAINNGRGDGFALGGTTATGEIKQI